EVYEVRANLQFVVLARQLNALADARVRVPDAWRWELIAGSFKLREKAGKSRSAGVVVLCSRVAERAADASAATKRPDWCGKGMRSAVVLVGHVRCICQVVKRKGIGCAGCRGSLCRQGTADEDRLTVVCPAVVPLLTPPSLV